MREVFADTFFWTALANPQTSMINLGENLLKKMRFVGIGV